jgi:hypothetical protein
MLQPSPEMVTAPRPRPAVYTQREAPDHGHPRGSRSTLHTVSVSAHGVGPRTATGRALRAAGDPRVSEARPVAADAARAAALTYDPDSDLQPYPADVLNGMQAVCAIAVSGGKLKPDGSGIATPGSPGDYSYAKVYGPPDNTAGVSARCPIG